MIKKLSDGRWEYRGDTYDAATGRRRQLRRRFPTKSAAAAFEKSQLVNGPAPAARQVPTFSACAEQWLPARAAARSLSANTVAHYKVAIKVLTPSLGSRRISAITPGMIESAAASLISSGSSPVTVRSYLFVAREILDRAVRDGLIPVNPVRSAELPRAPRLERSTPDAAEIRDMLASSAGTPAHLPLLLLVSTGMRVSELLGLQWDAVDLDASTLTVRRQRLRICGDLPAEAEEVPGTRTFLVEHTKTRLSRTVALPASVRDELRAARAAQLAAGRITPWVVARPDGTPVSYAWIRSILPAGVHAHALRHAHATILIDAGIPVPEVSRRLGHSSPAITVSTYIHAVRSQDARAAEAVTAALSASLRDTSGDTHGTP